MQLGGDTAANPEVTEKPNPTLPPIWGPNQRDEEPGPLMNLKGGQAMGQQPELGCSRKGKISPEISALGIL